MHRAFWSGALPRPMLGVFLPITESCADYAPFDFDTPVTEMIAKNASWARMMARRPDDRIMPMFVNFGVSFLAALAGGEFACDGYTTWSKPCADSVVRLRVRAFDEDLPLWRNYVAKLRALRDAKIDEAMVGLPDMTGPLDILAALVGNEQLCVDMMTEPDAVEQALSDCVQLWRAVHAAHVRELGLCAGGMLNLFQMFTPGAGALWSEDFTALMSPSLYQRLGCPADRAVAQGLGTTFIHVHSGAGACLPDILAIEALAGVEISNDPSGPGIERIVHWAQMAQAKGKSVILSNYDRPLADETVEMILHELDTSRLCVNLQCADHEQAWAYRRRFESWGSRS